MAALLLARLVTRPDMTLALEDFLSWQASALATTSGPSAVFVLPGILTTLALILKVGDRGRLLPYAPRVWVQLQDMAAGVWEGGQGSSGLSGGGGGGVRGGAVEGYAGNMLARKLGMKLGQRLGLSVLPRQQANWRYKREEACLDVTLAGTNVGTATLEGAVAAGAGGGGGPGGDGTGAVGGAAAGATSGDAGRIFTPGDTGDYPEAGDEDGYEVAEEVEGILGLLLSGISDKDTAVRWSAAKGVARIAGCLPCELAEEVVDQVVDLFSPVGERGVEGGGGKEAVGRGGRRGGGGDRGSWWGEG